MSVIITIEQLESFQTDHDPFPTFESQDQHRMQVAAVPAPGTDGATSHRSTTAVPSDPMDDLQLATWEDAEWR